MMCRFTRSSLTVTNMFVSLPLGCARPHEASKRLGPPDAYDNSTYLDILYLVPRSCHVAVYTLTIDAA